MSVQAAVEVALVPDMAAEWAYRRALAREAYARGYGEAWEAGRRSLLEELAAEQRVVCGPAVRVLADPDHAVMEVRRWGAGGRGRAGDARPGDHMGGDVTW